MGNYTKRLQGRLNPRPPFIPTDQDPRGQVHPLKGKEDGRCNRTICQSPGAFYFNTSTRAYYCWKCANDIEHWDRKNGPQGCFPNLTRNHEKELALHQQYHKELTNP